MSLASPQKTAAHCEVLCSAVELRNIAASQHLCLKRLSLTLSDRELFLEISSLSVWSTGKVSSTESLRHKVLREHCTWLGGEGLDLLTFDLTFAVSPLQ